MKKLILSFAFVLAFVCTSCTAFAASNDHIIKNWHTQVLYKANNVVQQVETITVDYLQPKHGFFRAMPSTIKIEQEIDSQLQTLTYVAKIKDITVTGALFEKERDNGFLILRIGDEDKTVTGEVTYQISFTYDIGDDRVSANDSIFYTLIGVDNEAVIENFSFDVKYEKPLPQATEQILYTGGYGSLQTDSGMAYEQNLNGISGYSTAPIYPGNAVTLYARLPEGYFVNERAFNPIIAYIALAFTAILGAIVIIFAFSKKRKAPIVTVEFSAPDGISSAEVGYIIDSAAEDKDILSLIIWFADKGFLTISGEEKAMVLHKVKPLPENYPHYMRTFFNGIFNKTDVCELANADTELYTAIQGAKAQLASEFSGKRKLFSSFGLVFAVLVPMLFAFLNALCSITATGALTPLGVLPFIVASVLLLFAGIGMFFAARSWLFSSMGSKAGFVVLIGVFLSFGLGLTILGSVALLVSFKPYALVAYAFCAVICLVACRAAIPTKYFTEISGKLLGLKSFIEKAELERIKLLVNDDATYFYSVLPYAYVFGLTDAWIKQFESLSLEPPQWYAQDNGRFIFSAYWMTRSLDSSYSQMVQKISAEQMKSGGNGGTSFGGGGGFSGGGFGGGGSGSW